MTTSVAAEARFSRVTHRIVDVVAAEPRVADVVAEPRAVPVGHYPRYWDVIREDRGPSAFVQAGGSGVAATAQSVAFPGDVAATRNVAITGFAAAAAAPHVGAVSVNEQIPGQSSEADSEALPGVVSTVRNVSVVAVEAIAVAVAGGGFSGGEGHVFVSADTIGAVGAAVDGVVGTVRNTTIVGVAAGCLGGTPSGAVSAVRNATVPGVVAVGSGATGSGMVELAVHAQISGVPGVGLGAASAGVVAVSRNTSVSGVLSTAVTAAAAGSSATTRTAVVSGFVASAAALTPNGVVVPVRHTSIIGLPATASAIADAGTVTAVMNLTRQRMNRSGTFSGSNGSEQTLNGWSSDATYPADVSGNALIVAGGGNSTVTFSINFATTFSVSGTCRLYRNGSQIGSTLTMSSNGTYNIVWSGTLSANDALTATFTKGGSFGSVSSGYIDAAPA